MERGLKRRTIASSSPRTNRSQSELPQQTLLAASWKRCQCQSLTASLLQYISALPSVLAAPFSGSAMEDNEINGTVGNPRGVEFLSTVFE